MEGLWAEGLGSTVQTATPLGPLKSGGGDADPDQASPAGEASLSCPGFHTPPAQDLRRGPLLKISLI